MKEQPRLAQMIKGQMFDGYLMVRSATQRTSSNGGKYLDMTLCDVSGEVNAKLWDGTVPPPNVADVLRIRGMMQEYNGKAQFRVDKMRLSTPADDIDMQQLILCAPESPESMLDEIRARIARMEDAQLRALVEMRLRECGKELMYYPAASRLHHAERSGLLHHTNTMLRGAEAICGIYPALDADLLAAGVILHDLCKIEEFVCDELGLATDYSTEGNLVGHIVMGVAQLDRCGKELGTDPELLMMLEHMLLSHHNLPEFGSPKPPMFPEAEVLHMVDDLDAKLFEMRSELEKVKPGCFSDFFKPLERKLYRRTEG